MAGFKKETAASPKQILFCTEPQVSVGIAVSDSGVTAGADGRKIVKAGSPYGKPYRKDNSVYISCDSFGRIKCGGRTAA